MTELLKNVTARVSGEVHPLLRASDEKNIDLVLFTSDRGLCGDLPPGDDQPLRRR